MPYRLQNPTSLPLEDLAPHPDVFVHPSRLHGQAHVCRVIVHSLVLADVLGLEKLTARVWAAAYIHDIGRWHDGRCTDHGQFALERVATLPRVKSLLAAGGVRDEDWEGISVAVENHCRREIPRTHPHWKLTAVLKDADALDRFRLGDLDPNFFRFPESQGLIPFAEALYESTDSELRPGPTFFAALWPIAQRLLDKMEEGHHSKGFRYN